MKKISHLPIIFALFLLPCSAQTIKTQNHEIEISCEEYAVYSAVINKMFAGDKVTFDTGEQIKRLVIADQTISLKRVEYVEGDDLGTVKQHMTEESQWEIVDDFALKNKEPKQLKDKFKTNLKRILVNKNEIPQEYTKDNKERWRKFYNSYPNSGGSIGFSRIGFDSQKKQAVVYIEHDCHDRCASGHFLLLRKTEEGWKVIKDFFVWRL